MRDVYDYAKFFIKNGADSLPNTFDGNMKLQKLLVFANFANVIEHGTPLFDEEVLAFENGCVVEKVRLRYKNDYYGFKKDSDAFQPDFTENEYDILNLTMKIFGNAAARELSDINHTFRFWRTAYENGTDDAGYHDKNRSVVNMTAYQDDIDKMKEIIQAYRETENDTSAKEVINGVTFYYEGFKLTDERIKELEAYALSADEDTYSVYVDNGKLVIY